MIKQAAEQLPGEQTRVNTSLLNVYMELQSTEESKIVARWFEYVMPMRPKRTHGPFLLECDHLVQLIAKIWSLMHWPDHFPSHKSLVNSSPPVQGDWSAPSSPFSGKIQKA